MPTRTLVLGTTNPGKIREFADLLRPLDIELRSLADFPPVLAVDETGETFEANAALKAVAQALYLKQWVLAEDSGIVVAALGGMPGVLSARYSDPGATDERNNQLLLANLAKVPNDRRGAYYECQICLADPTGKVRLRSAGRCHGRIRREPAGNGGFGYDPLFEITEYHRTFGELGDGVKAVLSHRARATEQLLGPLDELTRSKAWT